jgi:hypothetical protein
MTYALSAALQTAVYQQLVGDLVLTELVGDAIFDAMPAGQIPPLYVALGPETVRDRSDASGAGASHELSILIVTQAAGFSVAKQAAAAVSDALVDANLTLSRGSLVALNFLKASAARVGSGDTRRITLIFRARVCAGTPQSTQ